MKVVGLTNAMLSPTDGHLTVTLELAPADAAPALYAETGLFGVIVGVVLAKLPADVAIQAIETEAGALGVAIPKES